MTRRRKQTMAEAFEELDRALNELGRAMLDSFADTPGRAVWWIVAAVVLAILIGGIA